VRIATALLVGLGLTASGPFALAQTSSAGPATAAPRAQNAIEEPRAPAFEYLGTLRAETGTRTVVENGPQGTRTIVQVVGGRFEGPRLKAPVQTRSLAVEHHQGTAIYPRAAQIYQRTMVTILLLNRDSPCGIVIEVAAAKTIGSYIQFLMSRERH
jgi:hypothetical protein